MHVGITGHQRLEDEDAWIWVAVTMRNELAAFPEPLIGVTSLAIGADQLFARLMLERGGSLHVVLPYADIERSFSPDDARTYHNLVAHAATVEVLDRGGSDEDAYLAAGERVVDLSDVMLAVWDGQAAKGKGGTGDIVAYARGRRRPTIHISPAGTVTRLPTG